MKPDGTHRVTPRSNDASVCYCILSMFSFRDSGQIPNLGYLTRVSRVVCAFSIVVTPGGAVGLCG